MGVFVTMTKLLFCRICGSIVQTGNDATSCRCGNVAGFYLNNDSDIAVHAVKPEYARILAISSHFLWEKCTHKVFDLPYLRGTFFDQDKSHVVIYELDSERAKDSGVILMPTLEKLIELRISEKINAI